MQVSEANLCSKNDQRYYSISIVYMLCGYTLCDSFAAAIRTSRIKFNYKLFSACFYINTTLFFALSNEISERVLRFDR